MVKFFLYVLVTFSFRTFSCSCGVILYMLLVLSANTKTSVDSLISLMPAFNFCWKVFFWFLNLIELIVCRRSFLSISNFLLGWLGWMMTRFKTKYYRYIYIYICIYIIYIYIHIYIYIYICLYIKVFLLVCSVFIIQ